MIFPQDIYTLNCLECSKITTLNYSTSFSTGIKAFEKKLHYPIYAIYAYVRFADEIVDTFHSANKPQLLQDFRNQTVLAIDSELSINPILHSFQWVVNQYSISKDFIFAFLDSMGMDLHIQNHTRESYEKYIYGSAEVIGLMCLSVFCDNNDKQFKELTTTARALGSVFQKINFLRDLKSDFIERERIYFPNIDFENFNESQKKTIEFEILNEFLFAQKGIHKLPSSARLGVQLAYDFYFELFLKIKKTPHSVIMDKRIRVSNSRKVFLFIASFIKTKFSKS